MTKEEFISRLKENKQEFKDITELIEYRLPVLQYYLEKYKEPLYTMDKSKLDIAVDFSEITINTPDTQQRMQFMQHSFDQLVKRVEEFE